jgi:hypothetical protein
MYMAAYLVRTMGRSNKVMVRMMTESLSKMALACSVEDWENSEDVRE